MKPEDMNTLNADGKAYNGNNTAVGIALTLSAGVVLAALVMTIVAIFS